MTQKLRFDSGKKFEFLQIFQFLIPWRILKSKFFAADSWSPFNLELETVEIIKKDQFMREI